MKKYLDINEWTNVSTHGKRDPWTGRLYDSGGAIFGTVRGQRLSLKRYEYLRKKNWFSSEEFYCFVLEYSKEDGRNR